MNSLNIFLTDPNLIYLVLVCGLWVAVTAAYVPGTGVIEVLAALAICFSLVMMASMPVNWWAVLILVLGVLSFLLIPFLNDRLAQIAQGGLVLQAVGGWLLFSNPQVSPLLIAVTIGMALLYHHYALLPLLRKARQQGNVIDDNGHLIGAFGRAAAAFLPSGSSFVGSVNVRGEQWTAYSEQPVESGDTVVVLEREGLQLYVEGVKHKQTPRKEEEVA